MPKWTEEQLRAIEARGENILLSAAAGSGKTTVLVERVLRLIMEDGADVDRMLVVTFTRAAASDMRSKLSRQLNARAAEGDARCREQLLKLDRASISTLHAFCADFLRTHFEAAGVDPAFRILDDAVNARLRDERPAEVAPNLFVRAHNDRAEGGAAEFADDAQHDVKNADHADLRDESDVELCAGDDEKEEKLPGLRSVYRKNRGF